MKKFISILIISLLCCHLLSGQEFIATNAKLSKIAIGRTTSVGTNNALIMLNSLNDKFSFSIRLFPILTTAPGSDSISSLNQQIVLSYEALFPIDDLDFFDAGSGGKQYAMDGELALNGITRPVRVRFFMIESMSYDINTRNIYSYPARISFALEINPAEYGLDLETANFTEKIIVMVENGIINRSSSQFEQ